MVYAILDQVVDEYAPVVDGLEAHVDQVEAAAFAEDLGVSRRIYDLTRDLGVLQRATGPLVPMLDAPTAGFDQYDFEQELRRSLRNVSDHVTRTVERIKALRAQLQIILQVNSTLVAQRRTSEIQQVSEATYRQSEQLKRISSWAAILFARL